MKHERWKRIEQLYHAALERESGALDVFLAKACAGDEELRRELERPFPINYVTVDGQRFLVRLAVKQSGMCRNPNSARYRSVSQVRMRLSSDVATTIHHHNCARFAWCAGYTYRSRFVPKLCLK